VIVKVSFTYLQTGNNFEVLWYGMVAFVLIYGPQGLIVNFFSASEYLGTLTLKCQGVVQAKLVGISFIYTVQEPF
jgi:hypothetical protein